MRRPTRSGAHRDAVVVIAAGVVPVLLRLLVLPCTGIPQPAVHDEFSYLLAADTFAAGRLTNPPHPLWEHFEAPHVIQHPTYASKYFPGQGLVLALGQALAGHAWAGVLLGMGLGLGAATWMLRGWLPWRWTVLGAALLALRYGPAHYWWNSYWGGGLAAAGGALFIGALPRLQRGASVGRAVTAGSGLGLLLLTRPNEALWLAGPVVVLAGVLAGQRAHRAGRAAGGARCAAGWPRRVWLTGALAVAPALLFTGVHNRAVTGSALTLPYLLHERAYAAAPAFKWQSTRDLTPQRHEMLERWNAWWLAHRERGRQARGLLRQARLILDLPTRAADLRLADGRLTRASFGLLLLLALPWLLRDGRMRLPLLLAGAAFVDLMMITLYFEHYGAAWAGLRILLITRGAQRASARWRGCRRLGSPRLEGRRRRRGRTRPGPRLRPAWVWTAPVGCALVLTTGLQAIDASRPVARERWITVDRPAIIAELLRRPGADVVLVRYDDAHDLHQHWVYNAADVDGAPIVWAWEMGPERDREVFAHYAGRSFWLLEPDERPPRLTPLESRAPARSVSATEPGKLDGAHAGAGAAATPGGPAPP